MSIQLSFDLLAAAAKNSKIKNIFNLKEKYRLKNLLIQEFQFLLEYDASSQNQYRHQDFLRLPT